MKRNILLLCFVIFPLSLSIGCSQEVLSSDEEVTIKDWTYAFYKPINNTNTVNGAPQITKRTSTPYSLYSNKQSHFIIFTLVISNSGKKTIEIDGSQFELIDGSGKEYGIYKSEESIKSLKINPSLHKSINLIYEVPNDIEQDISIRYGNSNKQLLIGEYHIFEDDTMF
ncbi:DUF4352 domain-containing protein [Chengkuizengella axinellae]|uniref:DUF4352 domain-containing protein n=1 Tax=Chengkuizengella axinellae TaxID=3064388 RepID=A0ABT9IWB0_9BACL|nr:DUF4352 domain-containing protein [Chengkuizengella sp. 2205SS18-9]MDP5273664.1 DUF4352 domain-containing protein [Chengkuizengella sp. 2205SS18-9]